MKTLLVQPKVRDQADLKDWVSARVPIFYILVGGHDELVFDGQSLAVDEVTVGWCWKAV